MSEPPVSPLSVRRPSTPSGDDIGSLEVGNHADLIVVDRDPLSAAVDALPNTEVIATVLAGSTVAGRDLFEAL